jgi:hypothetical protein
MRLLPSFRPSHPQRIIFSLYLLSLAYCFSWVPWLATRSSRYGTEAQRFGYGWVWAGPEYPCALAEIESPKPVEQSAKKAPSADDQTGHFTKTSVVHRLRQSIRSAFFLPDSRCWSRN